MNYIEFLQERAFSEGYAQRMFDEVEEEKKLRREYDDEMHDRRRKRIGGHVMGALGTAGMIAHGAGAAAHGLLGKNIKHMATDLRQFGVDPKVLAKNNSRLKLANAALGLGASALTLGGLYRINKNKNQKISYEDYLREKGKGE